MSGARLRSCEIEVSRSDIPPLDVASARHSGLRSSRKIPFGHRPDPGSRRRQGTQRPAASQRARSGKRKTGENRIRIASS